MFVLATVKSIQWKRLFIYLFIGLLKLWTPSWITHSLVDTGLLVQEKHDPRSARICVFKGAVDKHGSGLSTDSGRHQILRPVPPLI